MKARISDNLTGTIMLGSISRKSLIAGQEFDLDDEQFWNADIQAAIKKGLILCRGASPSPKTIQVTNISLGSVSVPGVGVLRSGKTAEISMKVSKSIDIEHLVATKRVVLGKYKGKIAEEKGGDFIVHKAVPAPETEIEEEEVKPPVSKRIKAKPKAKKPKVVKKSSDSDLLLDTSAPAIDGSDIKNDDVLWVDHDETKRRIASHPILSKKIHHENDSD